MLTGEVAIQTAAPPKTSQPTMSRAFRCAGVASFVLIPAKKERDRKEDDAENVVRRALDSAPHLR